MNPESIINKTVIEKIAECNFFNHLGIKATTIGNGMVEATIILKDEYRQHLGIAHGGLICTIADSVAGFAAISVTPSEYEVATVELKISFLKPAKGLELYAKGWVIKKGRTFHFCEAEVWDEEILVAKVSTTMAVLKK